MDIITLNIYKVIKVENYEYEDAFGSMMSDVEMGLTADGTRFLLPRELDRLANKTAHGFLAEHLHKSIWLTVSQISHILALMNLDKKGLGVILKCTEPELCDLLSGKTQMVPHYSSRLMQALYFYLN